DTIIASTVSTSTPLKSVTPKQKNDKPIGKPVQPDTDNLTFILLLILVIFPAVFKYLFPHHFQSLFTMFKNPMLSMRHLKDHIRQNSHSSPIFYIFYGYSVSLFLYYAFFINTATLPDTNLTGSLAIITLLA